jgi:hypothetical protein
MMSVARRLTAMCVVPLPAAKTESPEYSATTSTYGDATEPTTTSTVKDPATNVHTPL